MKKQTQFDEIFKTIKDIGESDDGLMDILAETEASNEAAEDIEEPRFRVPYATAIPLVSRRWK